jgi:transcriptional regulator GlxA family with amidase domain
MTEHRVVVVAVESTQILDVTGPLEVFSTATRLWPAAQYRTDVVSALGGPVRASSGFTFATDPVADVREGLDTLLVAGGSDMDAACADEELLHHLRRLAANARRTTSVCSGAFLLAAAGLLDGRRATTHWAECQQLQRTHPQITVDTDAIYVRDGDTWTSAGVTSGIDLALALVADDHGQQAAAVAARQLVVYLRRTGGQAQYSALLAAQAVDSEPIRDLLAWLPDHLTEDQSVPALAARLHLSERHFSRLFRAKVHTSPADHVEAVRLEAACRLLETTSNTIEHVARRSGFGTPETMNRAFRRRLGTTPGEHRWHFGSTGEPHPSAPPRSHPSGGQADSRAAALARGRRADAQRR